MRKRLAAIVIGAMATLAGLGPTSASAATEFGDPCSATGGIMEDTFVQLSKNPGSPPSLAAPSSGVITSWRVNVALPLSGKTYPSKLDVFRPAGGAKSFTLVGQSSQGIVGQGANSFPTRIPVQAGDRLGFAGGGNVEWYCETGDPLDVLGYVEKGDVPLGGTQTFPAEAAGLQEAVSAVIEPDADNDGFGDETQDKCPQSAATQAACPVVTLNVSAAAQKKLVTLLITGPVAANVTVNGVVSLGKGKKAKLKGGTKAVTPGAFTKFKLRFTSALIKRLEELPPSKKLTLKVTTSAPNVIGAPTTKVIKVKLKGQG